MGPRDAGYTYGMDDPDLKDEEYALRVQQGDTDAFGVLMSRYEPKLMRYGSRFLARNEDVQDIVQDIFVNVYRNIKGFNPSQRFSPWIYRIAHNAFVNELRRKSHAPIALPDFDLFALHAPAPESADDVSERASLARLVESGLSSIPPKYREVLILYFMEDLSYKEIADVLHIPVATVGVRMLRAKNALKSEYADRNISL